jgi:hypothetical protein
VYSLWNIAIPALQIHLSFLDSDKENFCKDLIFLSIVAVYTSKGLIRNSGVIKTAGHDMQKECNNFICLSSCSVGGQKGSEGQCNYYYYYYY